jgi:apolipoprotein N-acyltransferase
MVVGLPMLLSLIIYWSYEPQGERAKVAVIQPNIDCYTEKFNNTAARQLQNILQLISQTPADSEVIVLPETALPESIDDDEPQLAGSVKAIAELVRTQRSQALMAAGASTIKYYEGGERPPFTARAGMGFNYDIFNSAIAINADTQDAIHHKMRLVVGVEAMPRLVRGLGEFVDLGGVTGELGRNDKATLFVKGGVKAGPAICYEGLYGEWFARFVREGANLMLVMSNDGWWGETAGHRRLFDFCRLRAIETRRAIARSANTGVSGFISSRGDVLQRLDWDKRGVLSEEVELSNRETTYVKYGDWVGRMSLLLTLLGVLYYAAYRIRRKNHLV